MSDSPPKKPLWLFFDECISRPLSKTLYDFYAEDFKKEDVNFFKISHLTEFVDAGTKDDVWVEQLKDVRWVVITRDGAGITTKQSLRKICRDLGRTHLVLSGSIQNNAMQKHAITEAWRYINLLPYLPGGTEARLKYSSVSGIQKVALEVEYKPIERWCAIHGIKFRAV